MSGLHTRKNVNNCKTDEFISKSKLAELTEEELAQVTGRQYYPGTTYGDGITYGSGVTYDNTYPPDYYTRSW